MVNPLHFLTAKRKHVQLQDSHARIRESIISPNTAWLSLNYPEKLSWLHFWGEKQKKNPNKQKDSSQSATHFVFQGAEEDCTMNKQSPTTSWWRGSSLVVQYHH